jgi:mannitol-specific phosphotransferase system IIBC component
MNRLATTFSLLLITALLVATSSAPTAAASNVRLIRILAGYTLPVLVTNDGGKKTGRRRWLGRLLPQVPR